MLKKAHTSVFAKLYSNAGLRYVLFCLKINVMRKKILTLLIITLSITGCNKTGKVPKKGVFSLVNGQTIVLDGVINSKSLDNFNSLYSKHKSLKTVHIKNCDGSKDDDTNLKLSKRVHDLGLTTHLMENGSIASGGVDFFISGIKRTRGTNTKIGVHSWSGNGQTATDFPVGHANHQPYIDYYKSVGLSDADAKAFYYFTINSAPAESIHWMTDSEIEKYKLITD